MDRARPGRRRPSSEIVTEGKRKKSADLQEIKKLLAGKSEDALVQLPLSKRGGSEHWDLPLEGWTRSLRNKVICLDHKNKEGVHGRSSKASPERHLRVMLTNVLWTDLGRKFRKTLPRNDANLCDTSKVQSDSLPSTSVDSIETCQKLDPLHQSLNLSERHLRVMLTNVLWTDLGRKFRKTLPRNDANLCDTSKVQSDSLPSTSVDSIETCQKLDPLHQSLNLSERVPRVILTDILGTELGRKYLKISPITEASLSDTANLKSEQLSSSSDGSLESCQEVNHHKNFLPERASKPSKTDNISAKQALREKEKHRDDAVVSPEKSDTQSKDLNSGNKGCDYLEEGTSNKNAPYSYSEIEHTPVSRKRRKRPRSNLHDSHNSKSSLLTEYMKEEENVSTVSSKLEESRKTSHQDPAPPEELTFEPLETEATELCSLTSQESGVTAASGRACSPTKSSESSVSSEVVENSSLAAKVVVSSDEEGPFEHKNSAILRIQPHQDYEIVNENQITSISQLSDLQLGACESVQMSSELCPYSPDMENISCIKPNSEEDLKLDFIFTSVYIGKIKGASKGSVTFTTKYIKIPFQVSMNEVSLSVDTAHLKRFGLWKSQDDDHSKRSHAILFLWVSSTYLEEIQTQLENPMLSQQSKANEFIFLELNSSISQREELKLKDIMMEISTTSGDLKLSHPLSWVQAFPLFQDLSSKESSFIHYYCASACSFPVAADIEMKRNSESQPSNSDAIKPTYTFLQKQSSGCYSLSITSNPDEEWREVRHTGPVQKLIVYPPPPTKGGLGVTNEDLECLEEGEFLNDVIIDFYLKYLLLEKASDELVERSHIFSSFFYKCLTRKENNLTEDNPDLSMAQRRHRRVRTWTRHINIFNKDYIFVPVNESSHWYLAVICFPWLEEAVYEDFPQTVSQQLQDQQSPQDNKTIDNDAHATSPGSASSEDSQSTEINMPVPKKMCKRPCILILDSLKAASIQNTVQNLREYLEVEWEVKRKTHREFSKANMVDLCPKVPKQDNSSDCGVYLLQYVESFFQDPIVNFELPIHLEKWFPRHVIKTKREDIRELILKLHLQQQKGISS
ncbi:sentrin-specific protease 7 isoform X2 [Meriones unguiculatus]|uniref:sentrin-specific protease 7 isoform X2 n=1 Tax=Meriones unguiculatus TaxID=10047 RepID=UPI00293E54E9|nr:sentrin-specific protease 7 isoform X2 [Meriones unguiculatus]